MIFGMYGATQENTLTRFDLNDIKEHGEVFVIKFPQMRTNEIRTCTIENDFAGYVRKYKELRPSTVSTSRFFIIYENGKCTNQPIGRNRFQAAPKAIAKYLNLPDSENYTPQSYRGIIDAVEDILALQRHSGWGSASGVDNYIEDSMSNEREIGSTEPVVTPTTTSSMDSSTVVIASTAAKRNPRRGKFFVKVFSIISVSVRKF